MSLAYMNLTLACLLFSAQFAMSKLYERHSAGTLASSLWMSVFNGVWCLLLFGILNGFRLAANAPPWVTPFCSRCLTSAAGYAQCWP